MLIWWLLVKMSQIFLSIFTEIPYIRFQHFQNMSEIHCIKNARNLKSTFDLNWNLDPLQVKWWLLDYGLFLNELPAYFGKCHKSNTTDIISQKYVHAGNSYKKYVIIWKSTFDLSWPKIPSVRLMWFILYLKLQTTL